MKAVFETTRQSAALSAEAHRSSRDLHVDLLVDKQLKEEEHMNDPHDRPVGPGSLFLPPGWKPNSVNNPINNTRMAQLFEAPITPPSMMKYSVSMAACVSQLNLTKGRLLLEDYHHLQPTGYHMQVAQAGTGMLVLCCVARCRYLRPTAVKPTPAMLRSFRASVAMGAPPPLPPPTDRRSIESTDNNHAHSLAHPHPHHSHSHSHAHTHSHSPPRTALPSGGFRATRTESVCISSSPLPILAPPHLAYTRAMLLQQIVRRSDEFTAASTLGASSEWPRQCAALYLCLGVPRLFLLDPSSLIPSACLDLHSVRRIAPSAQHLHCIDIHDQTNCVWQFSPEGMDFDDTREAARRWINTLASLCLPSTSVVHIIKSGYLHKRGRLNRAFKLRYFVLCSDLKLHYYKDDQHGMLKGTIDLSSDMSAQKASPTPAHQPHATHTHTTDRNDRNSGSGAAGGQKQVVRFDKELVVTMQATQRMYTLLAEDALVAEDWVVALNDLLASPFQQSTAHTAVGTLGALVAHNGGSLLADNDDEDGDDDEEE